MNEHVDEVVGFFEARREWKTLGADFAWQDFYVVQVLKHVKREVMDYGIFRGENTRQ